MATTTRTTAPAPASSSGGADQGVNRFRFYGYAKNAKGQLEGHDEIREWTATGSRHVASEWTGEIFRSMRAAQMLLGPRTAAEYERTRAVRTLGGAL